MPDTLPEPEQAVRLRPRVVGIALAGAALIALFVQWSDMLVGGTMAAGPFPPLAACLLWTALLAANALHSRLTRDAAPGRAALARGELLVILSAWVAANMVAGRGLLHPLLASLAGPSYYARSGAIARSVAQNLPDWLIVTDKAAVRGFYEGHGVAVPWAVWQRPLFTWGCFFLPFLTANVCLCALFERVWVRHERLAFPLVALPIEALHPPAARAGFDRRAVLLGMAFPLLLHVPGAAHAYLPAFPCVPFFNDVSGLLAAPPWAAAKPLYLNLYPLLIGLTFLAPKDVTLGLWFFLLLNKAEMVAAAAAGWNDGAGGGLTSAPPYLEEQSAGAYLAIAALLIWNARRHLQGIAGAMWRRGVSSDSVTGTGAREEYAVYRPLAWGFVCGIGGVMAWAVCTGLPLWFAACFFGFYFVVALVLSRLMAEGGVSWILAPILPDKLILSLAGSATLSPVALTRLILQVQHLRDTRQMLAPALVETGKLRDVANISVRAFYGLMLAAILVALGVGGAVALPLFYGHGALSLAPNSDGLTMSASVIPLTAVNQASARLLTPVHSSPGAALAVLTGALLTCALYALRLRYLWWPLHPLGYALTGTLQLGYANKMLFSLFLGWLFKTLTLRFGGAQGFRLLRGAALGLIMGDLLMGGALKLLDALLGPSGYAIF